MTRLNPLPATPIHIEPRCKDEVDPIYTLYKVVALPAWRKLTRRWRYPACGWPIKPKAVVEALYRSGELRPSVSMHELTYDELRRAYPGVLT